MGKKLVDGRKPGSGYHRYTLTPEQELNKKLGKYKVYYLYDKQEPGVPRYIGITKQWLCKRLAYHLYTTFKMDNISYRDIWIRETGRKRIGIEMIELLPKETTRNEALRIENEYIEKYKDTITNMNMNKFGETIKENKNKKIKKEVVDKIIELYEKGLSGNRISKKLNINIHIIHYWLKKKKLNKKEEVNEDVLKVKEYLLEHDFPGHKLLADILGIEESRIRYILKKNK